MSGAVYGTHLPYVPVTALTPAGAELVAVPTADGVTLTAWYTPSRNGAAVVLLHGSGGSRTDSIAQSVVLARHGYGVLALDARGGSASTAPGVPWGWHGNADIAAAITFLADQPGIDANRIGAVGLSMGGEQAITAAAADTRLRAVVAEGASLHTYGDLRYLPDDLGGWIQRVESVVMWQAADLMTSAAPPLALRDSVMSLDDRHILLIAGANADEAAAAADLVATAPENVTVWRLPDTPHISGLAWHPAEWEENVTTFLAGHL